MVEVGRYLSYLAERAGVDSSALLLFLQSPSPYKVDTATVVVQRLGQRIIAADLDVAVTAPTTTAIAFAPNAFDSALLHLVYHDAYWESAQYNVPRIDPAIVTRALFEATKPGGVVGVIDHVAPAGGDTRAVVEATHRIDPAVIRADFERAGFVFDGESDLLRNPQDDYAKNVFDPSIRGRTDRIVYRFRKPAR